MMMTKKTHRWKDADMLRHVKIPSRVAKVGTSKYNEYGKRTKYRNNEANTMKYNLRQLLTILTTVNCIYEKFYCVITDIICNFLAIV